MPVMMTRIMKKSTITVILGVIGALYLAYKFGQTRPVDEENSERDQHLEGKVICLRDWVYFYLFYFAFVLFLLVFNYKVMMTTMTIMMMMTVTTRTMPNLWIHLICLVYPELSNRNT